MKDKSMKDTFTQCSFFSSLSYTVSLGFTLLYGQNKSLFATVCLCCLTFYYY